MDKCEGACSCGACETCDTQTVKQVYCFASGAVRFCEECSRFDSCSTPEMTRDAVIDSYLTNIRNITRRIKELIDWKSDE